MKPDGSVVAYDWDANGNMIARTEGNQTTQFEYDYDNRLVKITYPNGSVVKFGYDGLGRRVFKQEGNNVRYFYYDGDRIIAEREGSSWVVRYLLGLRPCGFVANGQVRIYHADRLGSVRWVTDGSQNIVVSYVYEGFGKIVGQNGGGGGPYQFCGLWGYRNDWDGGLMHVGARYYEVETGRWVQKDPLLDEHPYVYVDNIPTVYIDPDGTCRRISGKWVCFLEHDGSYVVIIDPNHHPPGKPPFIPPKPPKGFIVIVDHDKGEPKPDIVVIPLPPPGHVISYIDDEDGKLVPIPIPKPKPKPKPKPPIEA